MLTLGIPANATIAMIFAALMVQGITPGPFMLVDHPQVFWGVVASMYIGNIMLLILNLPLVSVWVQLLKVPFTILGPIIILFTFIGAYSLKGQAIDIIVMLAFGILGYILRKLKFETGPLLMAFILTPLIENALRQSLLMSKGSFRIFVTRPISGTLLALFAFVVILQIVDGLRKRARRKHANQL